MASLAAALEIELTATDMHLISGLAWLAAAPWNMPAASVPDPYAARYLLDRATAGVGGSDNTNSNNDNNNNIDNNNIDNSNGRQGHAQNTQPSLDSWRLPKATQHKHQEL